MVERAVTAIRKLRASRGWTLSDLSAKSGIPVSTPSRLELGQSGLNYEKAVRLCRALDIEAEDLLVREPQASPAISGRRSVVRAGEGPLPLAAGDGVYFDATPGYDLVAPSGAARVLLVAAGDVSFADLSA